MTPMEMWCNRKPYVGFMRIFGSRVIALNKEIRHNKFEPKGDAYILVGYSEESKAYRLWKPGTRKVIKRRDVCFNEKLSEESTETNEYFEAPLNMLETYDKSIEIKTSEDRAQEDIDNEESNEDPGSSSEEKLSDSTSIKSTMKRVSGRPKILRIGKRGRPRKLFHEAANSAHIKDPDEPQA
ncbi:s00954 pol polyprotein [Lasius niger]|uniref:S00954 pol polyprotein n=1 Tax=Lasius niger TaxID=67767 RepID=A0A0J7KB57_LASNI|nr:s00954 pol polyprotein [Lasius niger]